MSKTCLECNITKDETEFGKNLQSKDGRRSTCKLCKRQSDRIRYASNPEKERERSRIKYATHLQEYREKRRARYAIHRESVLRKNRAYYASNFKTINKRRNSNHEEASIIRREKIYGLKDREYKSMLEKQKGRCAICRTDKPGGAGKKLHVDHNHRIGQVRGLLCQKCNNGLGLFNDDPEILERAINYLRNRW